MKKLLVKILTFSILINAIYLPFIIGDFNSLNNYEVESLYAQTASDQCPEEMTIDACIDYLESKADELKEQQKEFENLASEEEAKQLDLYEQIQYYRSLISKQESEIALLEVEIAKNENEILVLSKEIAILEEDISLASQEINRLEYLLKDRVSKAYKRSSTGVLDIILNHEEQQEILRSVKYLQKAREKDEELLSQMSDQKADLQDEQRLLSDKRTEVKEKQDDIESSKTALYQKQAELANQRQQQSNLLAESEERQEEYLARVQELQASQNEVTQIISKLIIERYQRGELPADTPVQKGEIIGFQGHTGFSYGSHLHFVYYNENDVPVNPFSAGVLSGGAYLQPVGRASGNAPLDSAVLTQTCHYPGCAIDMVSKAGTPWGTETYYVEPGAIKCYGMTHVGGTYYKNGEGAPIRAIKDGKVSAVQIDACGGKYVVVDHDDGSYSLYLHLQ